MSAIARQGSFMSGHDVRAADELEALRQLKARYCRFLDTKDVGSWRDVFTTDVVVTLDMAVSTGEPTP
jgi:SnoaL-like domain